ncbi:MAG: Yqey-like protein-domain-containing protein [Olpidium bornovanus]|uniref:Altered inheritance of mitochondria protein 41 n=1 Tax=Olpidium bornovanus TaxID=278681 RepID=A0A8H7ZNE2_9FUNG|nr:MAG: Yqey-like protein-domain-containing protein [Olpidium bornovanus]
MAFRAAAAVAAWQNVRCGLKPASAARFASFGIRSAVASLSHPYSSGPAADPAPTVEAPSEPVAEVVPTTTIFDRIKEDVKKSMKARDRSRVAALKGLLNDINYAEKSRVPPKKFNSDEDVVSFIQRSISKRDDSIAMFRAGSREDLAANEEAEIVVLREFLPPQLTIKEIDDVVLKTCLETGAANIKVRTVAIFPFSSIDGREAVPAVQWCEQTGRLPFQEFNRVMKAVPISFAQAPRAVVAAAARRFLTEPEKYGLC